MPTIPSIILWTLAWIFLVIGLIALTILVIYTKYGREKSIRLSILGILFGSIFLGFSIHFFLLTWGI
ncbi:MAG: hypothetical protein Lokiarch_03310 [Candidatus Lokiarchaeum sp. GC14_75]|nr:MAG: hypothetical protein Lokiarch_03310 [Candidatus Lokiarchaeum sp. GC14_75]